MRLASKLICIILILLPQISLGDEYFIDGSSTGKLGIGDFQCSSCPNSKHSVFHLTEGKSGTISAGELWTFFNNQGNSSLTKITLCLDVDDVEVGTDISLNSVELRIEDPNQKGKFLTEVGFGDDSLLVSGYETASFKPEAKLEFELGYDFMKVFSSQSKENVFVNFDVNDEDYAAANPVLLVQSSAGGFLFDTKTGFFLLLFSLFWIGVFNLVSRFTDPDKQVKQSNLMPANEIESKVPSSKAKSKPQSELVSS